MDQSGELSRLLIESKTYREFLGKAFDHFKQTRKYFNYAEFARKAGFSSRSYPRDVILGQKRVSAASLPKFVTALGLRGDARNYFSLLVASEEPDANFDKLSPSQISQKLEKMKGRMLGKQAQAEVQPTLQSVYRFQHWMPVYVSLGTLEKGASLAEIVMRTRLPESVVSKVLDEMCQLSVIRRDETSFRYFSQDLHFIFNDLGKNEFFRQCFLNAVSEAYKSAQTTFEAEDRLFFHTVLSVDRAKLPALKRELRELLLGFVDQNERPEGDSVAKISLAMLPQ